MIFAKIEQGRCANILQFDSEEKAIEIGENLVRLEEGYGIGDGYNNGVWGKYQKTESEIKEEREKAIKEELNELDNTINRATEDLYVLTETTPYETIQKVINRKIELREELQTLTGGDLSAKNNTNEQ